MVDINEILKKYDSEDVKEGSDEKTNQTADNLSQVKVDMADIPIGEQNKEPKIEVEEKREKRRKKKEVKSDKLRRRIRRERRRAKRADNWWW
jgi:hypothetical protein